jgi:putative membrane protein
MPVPLHWHNEPLLLFSLLFLGWAYAVGTWPLRARLAPPGTPFPVGRAVLFYSALALNYLAVGSPLDQFGEDYLFCVHMVQHLLIVYVTPPMLLLGTPWWLADALLGRPWIKKCFAPFVHPAFCCAAFVVIFSLWHLPEFYEAALRNRPIHILEHFTIFITALQMWWLFLSPSRALPPCGYPVRILCAFFLTVGHMPLLGLLTLATDPLYRTYELAPRIIPGFDAMQDQVLGATAMEISAVSVSVGLMAWSFWGWMREDERNAIAARAARLRTAAAPPSPS